MNGDGQRRVFPAEADDFQFVRLQTKVLFVSNYTEEAYVEEALSLGVSGYVRKSRAATELVTVIRTALAGQFYRPRF